MPKDFTHRLPSITAVFFLVLTLGVPAFGQLLWDSFGDGEFTTNPTWTGLTSSWGIVANSDVAAGATGSNTLRLNAPAFAGTEYLSSQISPWGTSQEWGLFWGRRFQAHTAANQQYFWLYANEANLNSSTVDGYRIAIGDDSGADEIRLQYIVDGAVSTTVITSTGTIPNGLTDIGFLIRVTRSATGDWELFTSTLPTTTGTGAVATDTPTAANTSVSQGTGTNNLLVPAANGFIGVAALHSTGASAVSAAEFDQIFFTPNAPTAASVSVGGRVMTADGRGISGAVVTIFGGDLSALTARTSPFGYYTFEGIPVGYAYIISVNAKGYTFSQRVITVHDSVTDADFVAEE